MNNHGSHLTLDGLSSHYDYYKTKYFPKLLNDNTIPEKDKTIIKNLLTKLGIYMYFDIARGAVNLSINHLLVVVFDKKIQPVPHMF